jgi:hypothetical protein
MKQQHKAMFVALRAGTLDPVIDQLPGETSPACAGVPASPGRVSLPALAAAPAYAMPPVRTLTPVPPPPLPAFDRHIRTPLPPPLRTPSPPALRSHPLMPAPQPMLADTPRAHPGAPYLYAAAVPASEPLPLLSKDEVEALPPQRPPKNSSGARRLGRPVALSDVKPNAQSIFGVPTSVREQSLDNAIQSYLEAAPGDPAAK